VPIQPLSICEGKAGGGPFSKRPFLELLAATQIFLLTEGMDTQRLKKGQCFAFWFKGGGYLHLLLSAVCRSIATSSRVSWRNGCYIVNFRLNF
jgi:hypothetical protein